MIFVETNAAGESQIRLQFDSGWSVAILPEKGTGLAMVVAWGSRSPIPDARHGGASTPEPVDGDGVARMIAMAASAASTGGPTP